MPTMSEASGTSEPMVAVEQVAADQPSPVEGAIPSIHPPVDSPSFALSLEELGSMIETKQDVIEGARVRYEASLAELKEHEQALEVLKIAQAHTAQGGKVTLTLHSPSAMTVEHAAS